MSMVPLERCPLCGRASSLPAALDDFFADAFGAADDGSPIKSGMTTREWAFVLDAIHDAARLALALEACNALIVHRVPRGGEGRRDLVTIGAYAEMAFARRDAERRVAQLERRLAGLPEPEEEFGAEMMEPAER